MITFHSSQPDCARHARKNENAGTVNFITQIAPSICALMHTKRVKADATIFKSRCSRTVMCYRLDRLQALPLSQAKVFRLAHISPTVARSPVRRSSDGREPSGKTSGEMSRVMSAQRPVSGSSNAAECPSRWLTRQLASRRSWTRNGRAGNLRDNSQDGHATAAPQFAQRPTQHLARGSSDSHRQLSTMTFKNYEHINHTNARS